MTYLVLTFFFFLLSVFSIDFRAFGKKKLWMLVDIHTRTASTCNKNILNKIYIYIKFSKLRGESFLIN